MLLLPSITLIIFISSCFANQQNLKHKPEQGIFHFSLKDSSQQIFVFKTLYENSTISIQYNASFSDCTYDKSIFLHATIFGTPCKGEFFNNESHLKQCIKKPQECSSKYNGQKLLATANFTCQKSGVVKFIENWSDLKFSNDRKAAKEQLEKVPTPQQKKKKRKAETTDNKGKKPEFDYISSVPFLGQYIVAVQLSGVELSKHAHVELVIKMKTPLGYLSADEYPLLTFYLAMCVVYVLYCLFWLIVSVCNCQDLLRIQYWIGGVIILGLIEKIVYCAEYANVNNTGLSNQEMEKFAGSVACLKRAVSRMLVIVVSLGFGIVKPRLGPNLYRVLGIGIIYFIVAILVKMLEIDVYFNSGSREALLLMYMPLVVIDIVICWWIFTSLLETMKTLRLRRNTTKLSLYRHFSNTIVFCAFVSLAMMIYIIYYHELGCSTDFANDWFETACWPLLFSVILLVIMILWRPSANNQRYAYSPMVDGNDSEDDIVEPMLGNGATESMKVRGTKTTEFMKPDVDSTEENLKWIDENIPETVADAALPVLMDPDDVKKATKYEMSKMD